MDDQIYLSEVETEEEEPEKIVEKPKKKASAKQLESLEKGRKVRVEQAKIRNQEIARIKNETAGKKKRIVAPKPEPEPVKSDTESEASIIIVKKSKPKKKPTKIIYESESESSDEEPVVIKKKPKSKPVLVPVSVGPKIKFV